MTPAATVLHLFIGQYGLAFLAPVHLGFLSVGQTTLIHLEKDDLLPSVIVRMTGGNFPIPVITETHSLQLGFHGLDIVIGPGRGMNIVFDGGIFSRHPESVPSHGVKYIFSAHPFISGNHITDGIVSHMAHVDFSRGIRKHLQKIIFFFRGFFQYFENIVFIPVFLPFRLNFMRVIFHILFFRNLSCRSDYFFSMIEA